MKIHQKQKVSQWLINFGESSLAEPVINTCIWWYNNRCCRQAHHDNIPHNPAHLLKMMKEETEITKVLLQLLCMYVNIFSENACKLENKSNVEHACGNKC